MKRLVDLTEPPMPGETYLVPVTDLGGALPVGIPVMGPEHSDPELGNTPNHYHIDYRFVTEKELESAGFSIFDLDMRYHYHTVALNTDIAREGYYSLRKLHKATRPIVTWEEARPCLRGFGPNLDDWRANGIDFFANKLREEKFRLNSDCKVCPHRGARLGNAEVKDGVLKCPLHGLKFSASTGEVL